MGNVVRKKKKKEKQAEGTLAVDVHVVGFSYPTDMTRATIAEGHVEGSKLRFSE